MQLYNFISGMSTRLDFYIRYMYTWAGALYYVPVKYKFGKGHLDILRIKTLGRTRFLGAFPRLQLHLLSSIGTMKLALDRQQGWRKCL